MLREGGEDDANSMRARFEKMIRAAQDEIRGAIEELDGQKFQEDAWTRPAAAAASRVLQGGDVFEKAGRQRLRRVRPDAPEAYRAATGEQGAGKEMIPFFAAGISSVMHPHNPMAPTVHFNYRYFETDSPEGAENAPKAWWFGGGTDLTPSYIFPEDAEHFHGTLKEVCDKHDEAFYPRFKEWADDYFIIKHRMNERRGIGGVFFDDMNDRPQEELLAFATDMASAVVPAYVPSSPSTRTTSSRAGARVAADASRELRRVQPSSTTEAPPSACARGAGSSPSSCPCRSLRGGSTAAARGGVQGGGRLSTRSGTPGPGSREREK